MTRNDQRAPQADTTTASGIESGIVIVLFVGLGYALDAWLVAATALRAMRTGGQASSETGKTATVSHGEPGSDSTEEGS